MKKLFIAVLIFRLVISFLPAMGIDMGCWKAWAMRMVEVGPGNFYSIKIFTDNPPGYLYVFWGIGEIWRKWGNWGIWGNWGFEWLLKLPANLFDLGTGLLIYKIISHKRPGLARLGFLLYTLNPAIWFNSSVFGQFDGAGAFFGLLSVYLLLEPIRPISLIRLIGAGAALAVAWTVKPQAIAIVPAVGILALRELGGIRGIRRIREIIMAAGVFILTTLLLYWPFFPNNPLGGIFYVFSRMNNIYSCTTCFAFNFWGMFGNWGNDQMLFLGIPLMVWGIGLAGVTMLGILGKVGKLGKAGEARIYLAIAISVMAFFMFVTRMHERYLLPFFAFFLISAILSKSRFLMLSYILISGLSLLNVYYPYANYNPQYGLTPGLVIWLGEHFRALSAVGFGSFLVLCGWSLKNDLTPTLSFQEREKAIRRNPLFLREGRVSSFRQSLDSRLPLGHELEAEWRGNDTKNSEARKLSWTRREMIIVFLLVFVSFLIRVIRLDIPKTFYFDEVYHAFTAVELEKGNKMAWEWWNSPPAGFAYEWTHPPLAKEMMIGGMKIFGSDAVGWRFPGVVMGTGVIFLIYLLGKQLFNVRAGLIAAFLASMDGLLFTQSRIGMNDIYFLFFMLLAFYLFVKSSLNNVHVYTRKGIFLLVLMGISLGLALAGKWTAVYGIGILGFLGGLGILGKLRKLGTKKIVLSTFYLLLSTLILPLAVYLLTYLPFFTSGHTWDQFIELQRQMWWYHTGLKAIHPYTSPWYSWPFLQRPVWYYVNYSSGMVANIYGLGNPAVWWAGLLAVGFATVEVIKYLFSKWEMGSEKLETEVRSGKSRNLISHFRIQLPTSHVSLLPVVFVLLGYFGFFLPWALSPRIMFLYHYLPSLPFLCLGLGFALDRLSLIKSINIIGIRGKTLVFAFLLLSFLTFVYFYPQLAALPVPKAWSDQYFWFASWR